MIARGPNYSADWENVKDNREIDSRVYHYRRKCGVEGSFSKFELSTYESIRMPSGEFGLSRRRYGFYTYR